MWWNPMEHIMNIQLWKNPNPNISISQSGVGFGSPKNASFWLAHISTSCVVIWNIKEHWFQF
jgi:hypothetical protein